MSSGVNSIKEFPLLRVIGKSRVAAEQIEFASIVFESRVVYLAGPINSAFPTPARKYGASSLFSLRGNQNGRLKIKTSGRNEISLL
jgi:hypothetical protein